MISPIAGSTPTTPSSLYSTPPMISDRPGSLSPISLPPTHAEQNSDSSFSTLQLSPSSRQSIDSLSTKASSEGSSPATLSPPVTRSPSPPSSQSSEQQTRKEKKKALEAISRGISRNRIHSENTSALCQISRFFWTR